MLWAIRIELSLTISWTSFEPSEFFNTIDPKRSLDQAGPHLEAFRTNLFPGHPLAAVGEDGVRQGSAREHAGAQQGGWPVRLNLLAPDDAKKMIEWIPVPAKATLVGFRVALVSTTPSCITTSPDH